MNNQEINEENKHKYGEVPTPEYLIDEMLDKLPTSVWKDPLKKWLDPATGFGSFQIHVYKRLMKSLTSWEPNKDKREKHILENMLYMYEINPRVIRKLKQNLSNSKNIFLGDFLKFDFHSQTFDIILGNPPFNEEQNSKTDDGKRSTGNTIWIEFVEKSLELLSKNGYLLFLHPPDGENLHRKHLKQMDYLRKWR
jgi:type I restriction-modification system DNA methylase subunit